MQKGLERSIESLDLAGDFPLDPYAFLTKETFETVKQNLMPKKKKKKKLTESNTTPDELLRLKHRLIRQQDSNIISKKYEFDLMSNRELIIVSEEIERDNKIMQQVIQIRVLLNVIWLVTDLVIKKISGSSYASLYSMQNKNSMYYTRLIYRHVENKIAQEEKANEVIETPPMSDIVNSTLKAAVGIVAINGICSRFGPGAAAYAKSMVESFGGSFSDEGFENLKKKSDSIQSGVDGVAGFINKMVQTPQEPRIEVVNTASEDAIDGDDPPFGLDD